MNEKRKAQIEGYKNAQYIDDRELFTFANIDKNPRKIYGMTFVSIKGESLYVFDADYSGPKGEPVFVIPIKEMEDLKIPSRFQILLMSRMSFKYNGDVYSFAGGIIKGMPISDALLDINASK